jgi:hypothetical protein
MLFLLLCAVLGEFFQPGIICQAPASLLAHTDRTYKDAPTNIQGQILISLFRIGTLAMALCLCLCSDEQFRFLTFIAVCGIVIALFLVKMLANVLIDYAFMLSRSFEPAYEHYGNIFTLAACALYPCLLVLMRIGDTHTARWVLAVAAILFMGMWTYRAIRFYVVSPIAMLYLAIYLGTAEILPFGALYFLTSKMIIVL